MIKSVLKKAATVSLAALFLIPTTASVGQAATLPTSDTITNPTACASYFTDVQPGVTFYAAINWLNCNNITHGYSDGSFGSTRNITRAETATFLYRVSGEAQRPVSGMVFTDVAFSDPHALGITWLKQKGITGGYANGSFAPKQQITRGELAAFLYRFADPSFTPPTTSPFTDMTPNSAFYKEATWMQSTGLIGGYSDGSFRPTRDVTRGETAKFLYALQTHLHGPQSVPTHGSEVWAKINTNIYSTNSFSSSKLKAVAGQQQMVRLSDKSGPMTKVRSGTTTGWVNTALLTDRAQGTTDKPFGNPSNYVQHVSNNIAEYCWNVTVRRWSNAKDMEDSEASYEGYRNADLGTDRVTPTEVIEMGVYYGDNPHHPGNKAIQLHECAHILQFRAYDYNYNLMRDEANALTGKDETYGYEHIADCMTDLMGGVRAGRDENGRSYEVLYKGTCSTAEYAAAQKILDGKTI